MTAIFNPLFEVLAPATDPLSYVSWCRSECIGRYGQWAPTTMDRFRWAGAVDANSKDTT